MYTIAKSYFNPISNMWKKVFTFFSLINLSITLLSLGLGKSIYVGGLGQVNMTHTCLMTSEWLIMHRLRKSDLKTFKDHQKIEFDGILQFGRIITIFVERDKFLEGFGLSYSEVKIAIASVIS